MDLETLDYFCTAVSSGSITNAGKALHVTQPTLSRRLAALEQELGCTLFFRRYGGIELTPQGDIFYSYACSLLDLSEKAIASVALESSNVNGVVHIGAGEAQVFDILASAMGNVREKYPGISFDLHVGTANDLMNRFAKGYFDVLLETDLQEHTDLNSMPIPGCDEWGLILRKDDPLAKLDAIRPKDLHGQPIILAKHQKRQLLKDWAGSSYQKMNIVATYNLPLNAMTLANYGVGNLLAYVGILRSSHFDLLCCRLLEPRIVVHHGVLWHKGPITKQTQVFLDELKLIN